MGINTCPACGEQFATLIQDMGYILHLESHLRNGKPVSRGHSTISRDESKPVDAAASGDVEKAGSPKPAAQLCEKCGHSEKKHNQTGKCWYCWSTEPCAALGQEVVDPYA